MPTLRPKQRLLWKLVTHPEGVEKALVQWPSVKLPVTGNNRLSATERLDIYANMYFFRILDAIREDYPRLISCIGETAYQNLITDYLIKHPPFHFSLRYAGEHLSIFLKKHGLTQKQPFLPDLACFEWALVDSFDAADKSVVHLKELQSISPDQWAKLHFSFVPSLILLTLNWPVQRIKPKGPAIKPKKNKTFLRIWRQDFKVYYRTIDPLEYRAIALLKEGKSFGDLCEHFAKTKGAKKSTSLISHYLQTWISDGLLATF